MTVLHTYRSHYTNAGRMIKGKTVGPWESRERVGKASLFPECDTFAIPAARGLLCVAAAAALTSSVISLQARASAAFIVRLGYCFQLIRVHSYAYCVRAFSLAGSFDSQR